MHHGETLGRAPKCVKCQRSGVARGAATSPGLRRLTQVVAAWQADCARCRSGSSWVGPGPAAAYRVALPGSYSSAVTTGASAPKPPATSTLPSGSSVAVWDWRGVTMLPAAVQDPLPGSYRSAEARAPLLPEPPATSTLPSGSSVAVWSARGVTMLPVAVQDPLPGSYSSAAATWAPERRPPATSTLPSRSSVAVKSWRGVPMFPVAVQDPLPGSYSSAEASGGLRLALLLPEPPATSTLPSGSRVAVWDWRGVGML